MDQRLSGVGQAVDELLNVRIHNTLDSVGDSGNTSGGGVKRVLIDVGHEAVDNSSGVTEIVLSNDSEKFGELVNGGSLDQGGLGQRDTIIDDFVDFGRLLRVSNDDIDQDVNGELGQVEIFILNED